MRFTVPRAQALPGMLPAEEPWQGTRGSGRARRRLGCEECCGLSHSSELSGLVPLVPLVGAGRWESFSLQPKR